MATQAKFNTVLPSNTIQQGLNYTGISSVYASKLNTFGQAENVMTANDVELSLNSFNPGSTASINIPASYKLLGNVYLKMEVSLSTLLAAANEAVDSQTYQDLITDQKANGQPSLIFSNADPYIPTYDPTVIPYGANSVGGFGESQVGTGSLGSGLPMDINFLAYQLIKQFTWRIPGCDRIYHQGIHIVPWLLDKCPTEEEKIKLAMMSGSGHFLYSYNMVSGDMNQKLYDLKVPINQYTGERKWIAQSNTGAVTNDNPTIIVNTITNPKFIIYALLPFPWTTIDKEKSGLYYPSHMTTSALELNIQFQDKNYMQVPGVRGYSGYQVTINSASLRFAYAQVATLTYYKPPIYKLPCSLPYGFVFPVKDYTQSENCSVNLLGLKNGEITQLLMFLHQQPGGTFPEVVATEDSGNLASSLRYTWRNEPMRNVQVEYAGQIIWKGIDDVYDFMNQFDNRKGWSSFKFPSLLTVKSVGSGRAPRLYTTGYLMAGDGTITMGANYAINANETYPKYAQTALNVPLGYFNASVDADTIAFNNAFQTFSDYYTGSSSSLSNFYDISNNELTGTMQKTFANNVTPATYKTQTGIDQYLRSLLSNGFFPSASTIPFAKIAAYSTLYPPSRGQLIFDKNEGVSEDFFKKFTNYYYSDQFFWTTIPVAEKIDQLRGPRDYNLGADFKDSNLIVKFSGVDPLRSSLANDVVKSIASKVRWDLHLIISITSAFIFNGDRAELMQ